MQQTKKAAFFHTALTSVNAFLLAFFLFVSSTVAVLYVTVLNPDFMVQVLQKQGFTDLIYQEYSKELEYLAEPAGVDPQVLLDTVTKEEMAWTLQRTVYYAYDENHPKGKALDTESVKARFAHRLTEYAKNQGFSIEQEVQAGIDNIAGLAITEYYKYATLPYMQHIGGFFRSIKNKVLPVLLAGVGLVAVMAVCLFLGKARTGAQKTAGLIWALSGAGLLNLAWPIAVLLFGRLEYLTVQIKSLYLFMQGYIRDILVIFIIVGAAMLALALLAFFCLYLWQRKKELAVEE